MNTYVDCISYLKQPIGLMLTPFVGISARLSALATQGATSLTIPNTMTSELNEYDAVYVFDGPSSEVLQAGAYVAPGATSIPLLNATAYQHAAGTPFCTDGASGSLGEQIFTASAWIEDQICYQALWETTYSGEILKMPSMRAALDNQRNLHFRPRHFPIITLSSMTLKTTQQTVTTYDVSQAIIDADQQAVDMPVMAALSSQGQGSPWQWSALKRSTNAWITIGYTAGFPVGQLPKPVERACGLLVNDLFVPIENSVGADQITQGKRTVVFAIRGDISGDSELVKRAEKLLAPYITQVV